MAYLIGPFESYVVNSNIKYDVVVLKSNRLFAFLESIFLDQFPHLNSHPTGCPFTGLVFFITIII